MVTSAREEGDRKGEGERDRYRSDQTPEYPAMLHLKGYTPYYNLNHEVQWHCF